VMPTPPHNHGWIVPANMGTAPNAGTVAGHAAGNSGGTPRQVSCSSVITRTETKTDYGVGQSSEKGILLLLDPSRGVRLSAARYGPIHDHRQSTSEA
jgi:hypothetical protein